MNTRIYLRFVILCLVVSSCSSRKPAEITQEAVPLDSDSILYNMDTLAAKPVSDSAEVGSTLDTNAAQQQRTELKFDDISYAGEQAIIYKTKKDYSQYVPVTLKSDKSKIVSYPSPKDVYYRGKLAKPLKLRDGFWLDNRGINPNSAFLAITYEDYANLPQAPLLADMMAGIEDKDPVTEIYSLGTRARYKDEIMEINEIIERNALKKFKKIK